jgi:hypothetical protein
MKEESTSNFALCGITFLEYIASGGRIILKWTLEKLVIREWIGFMWHRMQSSGRHL